MTRTANALKALWRVAMKALSWLLVLPILFYQHYITPFTPPSCRFTPTCSEYARQALLIHGPFKGLLLAVWRILRCNPWGGSGYDPVPPIKGKKVKSKKVKKGFTPSRFLRFCRHIRVGASRSKTLNVATPCSVLLAFSNGEKISCPILPCIFEQFWNFEEGV